MLLLIEPNDESPKSPHGSGDVYRPRGVMRNRLRPHEVVYNKHALLGSWGLGTDTKRRTAYYGLRRRMLPPIYMALNGYERYWEA